MSPFIHFSICETYCTLSQAQAALKEFRKEALIRKQQVKEKKLPANQFISWLIGQEAVINAIVISVSNT